jgi:hypothetical protein
MTPRDGLLRTLDCVPPQVRETLSGMLRFHRREAKPQWWRRYEWIARPPAELVADPRTLGELHRTEREPFKSAPRKRRLACTSTDGRIRSSPTSSRLATSFDGMMRPS